MRYYDLGLDAQKLIDESIKRRYGRSYAKLNVSERESVDRALAGTEMPEASSQRHTQALTESYQHEQEEPSWLEPDLDPANWRKLADRRVPWPQDVHPLDAVRQMSAFLAYRMLDQEANTMGRRVSDLVDPNVDTF